MLSYCSLTFAFIFKESHCYKAGTCSYYTLNWSEDETTLLCLFLQWWQFDHEKRPGLKKKLEYLTWILRFVNIQISVNHCDKREQLQAQQDGIYQRGTLGLIKKSSQGCLTDITFWCQWERISLIWPSHAHSSSCENVNCSHMLFKSFVCEGAKTACFRQWLN